MDDEIEVVGSEDELEDALERDEEQEKKKFHEQALKRYKWALDVEQRNRERAMDERRFEAGEHWPDELRAQREGDPNGARPCLVINRIPGFKMRVLNELMQSKPAIKVRPVDSIADPKVAGVYDGHIRLIQARLDTHQALKTAADQCVSVGWGYFRVETEYDGETFDQHICVKRIRNQWSVLLDPLREEPNGQDAKWGFVVRHMTKEAFEDAYPGKASSIPSDGDVDMLDEWFLDETVSVAEYWYVEEQTVAHYAQMVDGSQLRLNQEDYERAISEDTVVRSREIRRPVVYQAIISGADVLEEPVRQPGRFIPIIEMRAQEEVIDGEVSYKGIVRDLMDPQRMYNYWRSAGVEKVALEPKAPFVGYEGQFRSPKWKHANVRNYAYLEASFPEGWPSDRPLPLPQRQPGPQTSPGISEQIMVAGQELKDVAGIHDPAIGEVTPDTSGIAINSRRQGSEAGQYHYADAMAEALRHLGNVLIAMIPDVYPGDRVIQVLDGQDRPGSAVIGQTPINGQQPLNLRLGRYDAVVDLGPSFATKRQESQSFMLELSRHNPNFANLVADWLVKNADVEGSEEMARRFRTLLPPHILEAENPEVAQVAQHYQQQIQQAEQAIQMMGQQIQVLQQQLSDRDKEFQIALADLKRKTADDLRDYVEKMTKLELEYTTNVPGSAV